MNAAAILQLLTRHFWWKLLSLTLAVALWAAVVGEPELGTMQSVPVLYNNLPHSLILLSDAVPGVQLELRGPSRQLTREKLAPAAIMLDLSGVKAPGEQTFTISRADLAIPEGVDFLRAVPSQLRLRFDRYVTNDVPVEVRTSGHVANGFRVVGTTASPERLRISGPETHVDSVRTAETDSVDVSGLRASTEVRINTFVADPRVQFESPSVVTVRINVEPAVEPGASQPSSGQPSKDDP